MPWMLIAQTREIAAAASHSLLDGRGMGRILGASCGETLGEMNQGRMTHNKGELQLEAASMPRVSLETISAPRIANLQYRRSRV